MVDYENEGPYCCEGTGWKATNQLTDSKRNTTQRERRFNARFFSILRLCLCVSVCRARAVVPNPTQLWSGVPTGDV